MSVTIAGITFEHHEYDGAGHVIGMTLVNVRWLLDRDGELMITWPAGHVRAAELAPALASAA